MVFRNCQCEGAGQKLRGADSVQLRCCFFEWPASSPAVEIVQLSIRMAIRGGVKKKMTFVWISFSHNMCGRKTK